MVVNALLKYFVFPDGKNCRGLHFILFWLSYVLGGLRLNPRGCSNVFRCWYVWGYHLTCSKKSKVYRKMFSNSFDVSQSLTSLLWSLLCWVVPFCWMSTCCHICKFLFVKSFYRKVAATLTVSSFYSPLVVWVSLWLRMIMLCMALSTYLELYMGNSWHGERIDATGSLVRLKAWATTKCFGTCNASAKMLDRKTWNSCEWSFYLTSFEAEIVCWLILRNMGSTA